MSDNLKLVQQFAKQYQAGNETHLAILTAPDFLYYINLGEALRFKQFVKRMWLLRSNSITSFSEISSADDTHFFYDF